MQKVTSRILSGFHDHFLPTEIAVAEVMVSRFIAGDEIRYIAADYNKPEKAVVAAIRFFYLKGRGNRVVNRVYDDFNTRRIEGMVVSGEASL